MSDARREPLWENLYRLPKERKAEIVHGRIVLLPMTGDEPGVAADTVALSLQIFAKAARPGLGLGSNRAFRAHLPNRGSFSPDASYYTGPRAGMKFYPEPPAFAVEVRCESDYGPAAERAMAAKRRDYLAAGTLVVWDVDLLSPEVVRVFRDGDAETPAVVYRRGERAAAEPAVPGWTMAVDELFG